MSKRYLSGGNRYRFGSVSRAAHYCCEQLEQRQMLSTITWTNRGTSTNDSDRFAAVFGTLANQARAVIDADLTYWSRVINNFNYSNGTNTYSVSISMNSAALTTPGTGVGANATVTSTIGTNPPKPYTATVGIGWRSGVTATTNTAAGWYLDPTPMDNSEFTTRQTGGFSGGILYPTTNAFTGIAPTGSTTGALNGADLLTGVMHELGHAMGLSSNNTINSYSTDTGVIDTVNTPAASPAAHLYRFDSTNAHVLWTAWDSGGASGGASNTSGSQHYAPQTTTVTQAGRTYYGATALMNAYFTNRSIIDDGIVNMLHDAYGYTTTLPSSFGTFYDRLDSNGTLTIQPPTGNSNDTVDIQLVNTSLIVTMGIGTAVPGIDPTTIQSTFVASSVTSISVDTGAGSDTITIHPISQAIPINVNGGDGTDYIRIEGTSFSAMNVNGGNDDDFIDFSFNAKTLTNISGSVNVSGGAGYDQVYAYDNNDTVAKFFTITSARFDGTGWGGLYYSSDVEALNLITGTAADTVNVQSTFANQPVFLNSAGGADVVTVGNQTNGVRSIMANVTVNNSPYFSIVNINDTGDSVARTATIDFAGSSAYGEVNNVAPAHIIWTTSDVSSVDITTGSAADTVIDYASNVPVTITSSGGNDTVSLGDSSVSGAQNISSSVFIDNPGAFTTLNLDDFNDPTARTITMNYNTSTFVATVLGLAPATITYQLFGVGTINLETGNGNDTINDLGDTRGSHIYNGGGTDAVTIGNSTTGMQNITSYVSLYNAGGRSTLSITDAGDTSARTVNVNYLSGTGSVGGFITPYSAGVTWTSDALVPSTPVSILTGSAADTVNVLGNNVPLSLSSTGGADTANIGNNTNSLNGILGSIAITNPPNYTTFNIDDTANTAGRNWTFGSDGTNGTITLAPSVSITYKIADAIPGTINLSNGVDNVRITGTDVRPVTLNGNDGNDVFTLGSAGNIVDPINAAIGINGGLGTDSIILLNSGDTTESGFTMTGGTVTESDMAALSLAQDESLELRGGTGSAPIHTFSDTQSGVFLRLVPGASHDIVRVTNNSNLLTIASSAGADDVSVNDGLSASGARVAFDSTIALGTLAINGLGTATATGSNTVLSVNQLTIAATGLLDLNNNSMIVDYTGASPLATVQGAIKTGRANGAWNGYGITSTTARNNSAHNTSLGLIEASAFKSIYGSAALFSGQTVDTTALLIKYTYNGDANFDGKVDANDYARIDAGFQNQHNSGFVAGWLTGDFNYDGKIDANDYALIDGAFQTQGSPLISVDPGKAGQPLPSGGFLVGGLTGGARTGSSVRN